MFFVLVGLIVGGTIGEIIDFKERDKRGYYEEHNSLAIGLIIGGLIGLALGIWFTFAHLETKWEKVGKVELVAMKDNITTSGSFFLGSGSIGSRPVYHYYYKNGEYVCLGYVFTRRSFIKTKNEPPYFKIKFRKITKQPWKISIWGFPFFEDIMYVFQVPENSIVNSFNLDLE